jgi:hypothetical protein
VRRHAGFVQALTERARHLGQIDTNLVLGHGEEPALSRSPVR